MAVIGQGIGQITQRLLSKSRGKKKPRKGWASVEILKGLWFQGTFFIQSSSRLWSPLYSFFFCSFIKNFFVIHLDFPATGHRQITTTSNGTLYLSLYSILQCISDYGNNTFFAPFFGYYLSGVPFINNIFSHFNKRLELH